MKSIQKSIVPVLTLLLFEFCFFIFENYPKNIFDIRLFNSGYDYLPSFLTKILWYLFYISIIILICKYVFFNQQYFFIREYLKEVFLCLLKIFPIRLIVDIIILLVPPLIYTNAITFILDIIVIIMIFFIICNKINNKKSFKINKKLIFLFTSLLIINLIIYFFISTNKNKQIIDFLDYLNKKYLNISLLYEAQIMSFELSLYTLIFNFISIILIYAIFISLYENNSLYKIKKRLIILRCILILAGFFAFSVTKVILIPKNTLHIINVSGVNIIHHSDPNQFDCNYKLLKLFRMQGYGKEELVYSKSTVKIIYKNETIKTYKRRISQFPQESITRYEGDIYCFNTEAIMFIENNEPIAIITKEIYKHTENKKLTEVLEKLISYGSFDFLEYSYEYMIKYDKNFIKPFLESYSLGLYDESINNNLNKEFIIEFSNNALLKDFND